MDLNLHSPERRLIELKIGHADLNALVDMTAQALPIDELMLRRLKKRRLQLRDQISQLELSLDPPEPA
ncbi:YdcH family protein [Polaromonas sp.]|uniref:YdcH family protein n=1 Tax=Polaromonas sp. TaxID=1869339 RepID=UPI00184F7E5C|nr:YdcH family protein [Polaromonas sp.]NMM07038.1 YdcH family protein [Polaromonas sp.]